MRAASDRFRKALVLGVVAAASAALSACAPKRGALLVELTEVTPRSVEVGDRLRITGSGFPEGRPATVVFRGEATRAGEPVEQGLEVKAEARLVAPHALEVQVTPELAAAICQRSDPRHTTLRADLEVEFASVRGPRTTVNGRLEGVTLDVTPELRSDASLSMLRREGARFATFLGVEVARAEQGLSITGVAEKSRGSRAGLVPGDTVLELDGLFVHGLSDFVPTPNSRNARILVRRGLESLTLNADSSGFRFTSPALLSHAAALVAAVAFVFLLLASPFGRVIGLFERRLVERLRETQASPRGPRRTRARAVLSALARQVPSSLGRYLGLIAVTSALVLIAFGQSLIASEIDLPILALVTISSLVTVAIGTGGAGERPSLFAGLARAFAVLVHQLPLAVALFLTLLSTGSFRVFDIVRSQGGWPWQWHALSAPWLGLASLLALAGQVPLARPVSSLGRPNAESWRERAVDVAQWTHDLVVCGLLALTLLGGWAPGGLGTFSTDALGAALLLGKTWALLLGIALARWTLGPLDVVRVWRLSALWFVVPSLLILTLSLVVRRFPLGVAGAAFDRQGAFALSGALLLGLAWLMHRVVRQAKKATNELRVLPWL